MGGLKDKLMLEPSEQTQQMPITRPRTAPAALVQRARIALPGATRESNSAVAERFELTNATVVNGKPPS
jgi:hypothetical protein